MLIVTESDDIHHFFTSFGDVSDSPVDHEVAKILCKSWMLNVGTTIGEITQNAQRI